MARSFLIGTPPGVGDTYWALTKIEAMRAKLGLEHVTLCPMQTSKDRASFAGMCSFVDGVRFTAFNSGIAARAGEYWKAEHAAGLDVILWPNAVVDRGLRLERWLPDYDTNLEFELKTEETKHRGRVVLYASALDHPWSREAGGPDYWASIAGTLAHEFDELPLLVGSRWDQELADRMPYVESICGQTTLPQVADILKHAKVIVGLASGMTILGNHFMRPTVGLFPQKHSRGFMESWVKPNCPHVHTYLADLPPAEVAACALGFVGRERSALEQRA